MRRGEGKGNEREVAQSWKSRGQVHMHTTDFQVWPQQWDFEQITQKPCRVKMVNGQNFVSILHKPFPVWKKGAVEAPPRKKI